MNRATRLAPRPISPAAEAARMVIVIASALALMLAGDFLPV